MLREVHHIGYRVSNLDEAVARYQRLFGCTVVNRLVLRDGSPVACITMGTIQVDLIQNTTDPGQHLDHVAYIVDDLDAEVAALKASGAEFATKEPFVGITGARTIFLNVLGSRIQLISPAN